MTCLLSDNEQDLKDLIQDFENVTQNRAMEISVAKTKIMCMNRNGEIPAINLQLRQETIENVQNFIYLGSCVTSDGHVNLEVNQRISKASKAFEKLKRPLWSRKDISTKIKMKVFNSVVMNILLYGSETWTPLEQDLCRLETFQMRCLRCIIGVSRWDHLYNLDIRARCCEQPLVEALIRQRRLR